MTFLKQCASRALQRHGYSEKDAELLIQWLFPANTLQIVQNQQKVHGRFDAKKLFK